MTVPAKKTSLQALLDAQEGRSGTGGGRCRASNGSGAGWRGRSNTDRHRCATRPSRNSRWAEYEYEERGRRSRTTTPRGSSNPSGADGPTYEERMAKIERDAIMEAGRSAEEKDANDNDDISTWVGPLVDGKCTYYQDRDKRFPFETKERGSELLQQLLDANSSLLRLNQNRIEEEAVANSDSSGCNGNSKMSAEVIVRVGHGLYADKPTLRTKGVTWSTEEYSHPGFQRMYLRMKSIQRFTEVWALLERSTNIGVFDDVFERGTGTVRIAAIGGGPGYELLATKLFFEERAPDVELELISMDVCAAWKPYTELLGFHFIQYDINDEGTNPLDVAGLSKGDLDFCIVSCVMIYVTNNQTLDMFHKLIHEDMVKAILLSERGEKTRACRMMEDRGGAVIRLIDQAYGADERQAIFCSDEFRKAISPSTPHHSKCDLTFPNVPYEEHKHERASTGRSRCSK